MHASRPAPWKILLAFAIIYLVWGSTYLAIRVGVREMPPFLMAGLRFTVAGLVLYGWMRLTGVPSPSWREWRDATILGTLMFLLYYARVFLAEQRGPPVGGAFIVASSPRCPTLLSVIFSPTLRLHHEFDFGCLVWMLGVGL